MGTAWRRARTRGRGEDGGGRREGALRAGKDDDGEQPKFLAARASQSVQDAGVSGGAFRDRPPPSPEGRASDRLPATFHPSLNHLAALISSPANHSAHSSNSRHLIPHLILSRGTPPGAAAATPAPRSPSRPPRRPRPLPCHTRPEPSPTVHSPAQPAHRPACPRTQLPSSAPSSYARTRERLH